MKVRVHFKTPDTVDYALKDLTEEDREEVKGVIDRFIRYGEEATIEFDSEAGTATVIESRKT